MNFKKYYGYAMNVLVIAAILLFIVLGLNYIGLNNLPAPIEKLLGTHNERDNSISRDDNAVYSAVSESKDNKDFVSTASISYENARKLLEDISTNRDFLQEVYVENIFEEASEKFRAVVEFRDGNYLVELYDDNGQPVKTVKELDDQVEVTYYRNFREDTAKFNKGNFSIAEECGMVLDAKMFLDTEYELSEGEFSVENSDFGSILVVEFTKEIDGYVSREVFRLSTDYGVVVSAESYDGEVKVYSTKTDVLRYI